MAEPRSLGFIQSSQHYLRAIAAIHSRTPATAIAELVDNAKDAGAKRVKIGVVGLGDLKALSIRDDGKGMDREGLEKMFGFGYSELALDKGGVGEYGAGFKSGAMKLGRDALVITKHRRSRTAFCAMLSQTMHHEEGFEVLKQPIVEIEVGDPKDPHSMRVLTNDNASKESLKMILKYSGIVRSEDTLFQLLAKMRNQAGGTRVIISKLNKNLEIREDDIFFKLPDTTQFAYERKLSAYLSHVYGKMYEKDKNTNPVITIRGKRVDPVVWEATLHSGGTKDCYFTRDTLKDLGHFKCHMGFVLPLSQLPGSRKNRRPSNDNEPHGIVCLINGRAVELFTETKSQIHHAGKWTKYTYQQSKGVGARLVCELKVSADSNLKLMQNKDGFQKNEAYFDFMKKMDEHLRKFCQETMKKWIEVRCKNKNCRHSNIGKKGWHVWNENPYKKTFPRSGPSAYQRKNFTCLACRGEYHPLRYNHVLFKGSYQCTCVMDERNDEPPADDEEEEEEDLSDDYRHGSRRKRRNNSSPSPRRNRRNKRRRNRGENAGTRHLPHHISRAEAEKLQTASWKEIGRGDVIYVPFEQMDAGEDVVLYYLGKVMRRREEPMQNGEVGVTLKCQWMNGDEDHMIMEWENPNWMLKWPPSSTHGSDDIDEEDADEIKNVKAERGGNDGGGSRGGGGVRAVKVKQENGEKKDEDDDAGPGDSKQPQGGGGGGEEGEEEKGPDDAANDGDDDELLGIEIVDKRAKFRGKILRCEWLVKSYSGEEKRSLHVFFP
eukprot:jgi/Bigna1/68196/fgenesh1_pg.5_\